MPINIYLDFWIEDYILRSLVSGQFKPITDDKIKECATVAQPVEQLIRNQQVSGSIPLGGFWLWEKSPKIDMRIVFHLPPHP